MNKTNEYIKEFDEIIRSVTAAAGKGINSGYTIIDRGMPHTPATLKRGTMGIYTFLYNEEFLKSGKAGPNSNARFSNQHYLPRSSQSNLSKSILKDPAMQDLGITEDNVGDWIKKNTRRYAKRQLTWFRKNDRINWIFLDGIDKKNEILEKCEKAIEKYFDM